MTSGFGVDRSSDGSSGTTSQDIRKINGALYKPGIISGCTVSRNNNLSYDISAGVVAISTGSGEIVLAPVSATTKNVTSPTSGDRTDIIYAQQHYPSIEGDANIEVGVASSLPARAVELRTYILPQNASNTNSANPSGGIDFSIPYGASLGRLYKYTDTTVGKYNTTLVRKGSGTIRVPTDRRLRFAITTTLWANGATAGFDNAHYAEYAFLPSIDGNDICIWTTPGLGLAWSTLSFETYIDVAKGTHTVGYGQFRMSGNTDVYGYYGTDGNGYGRTGTTFTVMDDGPIV